MPERPLLDHPELLSARLTVNAWYQFCQIQMPRTPNMPAEGLFALLGRAFRRAKKGAGVGEAGAKRLAGRYGEDAWFGGGKKSAAIVFVVIPSTETPQLAIVRCYDHRSVRR